MNLNLHNKTALIAASSKGLGKATALSLAKEGVNLVICSRDKEILETTKNEIEEATKAQIIAITVDLTSAESITNLVNQARSEFGKIDILVTNNGGPRPGNFDDFNDHDWLDAFNLTFMSATRLIRAVLPEMKQQKWGRIINITSISAKQPVDNLILSNAIRPAIHGLTKSLAKEVGEHNITVNNVLPGYIHTDRVEQLAKSKADKEQIRPKQVIKNLAAGNSVPRIGEPHELGDLIAYLSSEQAGYMTGESILVDGGMHKGTP